MSFTPNIPATGQTLGQTRDPIRNNFTNYFDVMSVNHVAPNASGQGKHNFVEMPVQGSNPSTLSGEGGLFTKALSGSSILYYQRDANTTVNQPVLPMATGTFITRNSNGAATLVMGYNVTSVTRTATGQYTVVMSVTLPYVAGTTEYAVLFGFQGVPANEATLIYSIANTGLESTSFKIQIRDASGGFQDETNKRVSFTVIQ